MKKLLFLLFVFNLVHTMEPPEKEPPKKEQTVTIRVADNFDITDLTISRIFKMDDPKQVKKMIESNDEVIFSQNVLSYQLNCKRVDANEENIFHWLVKNRSRGLLEFACAWSQIECDINQKNRDKKTPLHLACMLKCETKEEKIKKIRLIRILEKKGSLYSLVDKNGKKPKEYLSRNELKMLKNPKSGQKKKKHRKKKKKKK